MRPVLTPQTYWREDRARQRRVVAADMALAASRLLETLRRARAARPNQPTTTAP